MKRIILLADDDEDDRMLFEEMCQGLPANNYAFVCVENGQDVLTYLNNLKADEAQPYLIVLDQNMPKLSGKETLETLKNSASFKHIPVIIYSTYNDKNFIQECEKLGVLAVVSKPDSYDGYMNMINSFLGINVKDKY